MEAEADGTRPTRDWAEREPEAGSRRRGGGCRRKLTIGTLPEAGGPVDTTVPRREAVTRREEEERMGWTEKREAGGNLPPNWAEGLPVGTRRR